jgi:MerR family transcriptional regulator, heat shock protein HspR
MTHPGADEREPLYAIAVAARLTGMHPQTLRKYERAGLLRPARVSGNQRLYSDADLGRLTRIRYLVEERGLNVAGLEMTLRMVDRLDAVRHDATALDLRAAIADALALTQDSVPRPGGTSDHRSRGGAPS